MPAFPIPTGLLRFAPWHFAGRLVLSGRKGVKNGALSSARPLSSAIFPTPVAPETTQAITGRMHPAKSSSRAPQAPASQAAKHQQKHQERQKPLQHQLFRPVNATVRPTPIIARPPAPPTSSKRRGERANQARTVLAATAQQQSEITPIVTETRASSSICSGTCPSARFTN